MAIRRKIDFELDSVQNYFDLAAKWEVTEKASVLLGINNVLDEDPPITQRRYDGQRQHVPADLRRAGQVDLPARQYRVLIPV